MSYSKAAFDSLQTRAARQHLAVWESSGAILFRDNSTPPRPVGRTTGYSIDEAAAFLDGWEASRS
jgi:hypothetical protein